jgi:hypothetical protein
MACVCVCMRAACLCLPYRVFMRGRRGDKPDKEHDADEVEETMTSVPDIIGREEWGACSCILLCVHAYALSCVCECVLV